MSASRFFCCWRLEIIGKVWKIRRRFFQFLFRIETHLLLHHLKKTAAKCSSRFNCNSVNLMARLLSEMNSHFINTDLKILCWDALWCPLSETHTQKVPPLLRFQFVHTLAWEAKRQKQKNRLTQHFDHRAPWSGRLMMAMMYGVSGWDCDCSWCYCWVHGGTNGRI